MSGDGKPNLSGRLLRFGAKALTPREFMLRVDGRLRYLRLGRWTQAALCGGALVGLVGLGGVGWRAYEFVQSKHDLSLALNAAHAERLALMQDVAAYDEAVAAMRDASSTEDDVAVAERRRAALAREALRRRVDDFAAEVDGDRFEAALSSLRARLVAGAEEQADIAAGRAALQDEIAVLRAELDDARRVGARADAAYAEASAALTAMTAAKDAADVAFADAADKGAELAASLTAETTARDAAESRAAALESALDERETALAAAEAALADRTNALDGTAQALAAAETRILNLEDALGETEVAVGAAVADRRVAEGARDEASSRASTAEARLAELEAAQIALFAEFAESARRNAAPMEKAIGLAGVNARKIVANALGRRRAQGGPYFASAATLGLSDAFETAATDAADAISRWEALRDVLRIMPLDTPMDQYRVTSGFGRRTDPVNGRPAMHYGLDLAHAMKAPILATSPGKVVFAGWKGNYGRFVEIDHGAGVRTRYGHLNKILVRRGQTVKFRQKIGLLGNSGRSTGPHLHYEITVDGRPLNPQKFIAAGRHVLKEW